MSADNNASGWSTVNSTTEICREDQREIRAEMQATHEDGHGFRRRGPDADADPGGRDRPDDVPSKEDDGEAEEVDGGGDGETGPGVANIVFGARWVV